MALQGFQGCTEAISIHAYQQKAGLGSRPGWVIIIERSENATPYGLKTEGFSESHYHPGRPSVLSSTSAGYQQEPRLFQLANIQMF